MPAVHTALIHSFDASNVLAIDDDGDTRLGFYFQFVDVDDLPVTGMFGPYKWRKQAERAARRAFAKRDY